MFRKLPEQTGLVILQLLRKMETQSYDRRQKSAAKITKLMKITPPAFDKDQDRKGHGILAAAIDCDIPPLVQFCLENDVDIDVTGARGETPLATLIRYSRWDHAGVLLSKKVDLQVKTLEKKSLLLQAVERGGVEIAEHLARHLPLKSGVNGHDIVFAAIVSFRTECLDWALNKMTPDWNDKYDGRGYLFHAVSSGSLEAFNRLIELGAPLDIFEADERGKTMFSVAYERQGYSDPSRKIYDLLLDVKKTWEQKQMRAAQQRVSAENSGWKLLGPDTVCRVDESREANYRLTQIFNFGSGVYTQINRNLETNVETSNIGEMGQTVAQQFVEEAARQLKELGGNPDAVTKSNRRGQSLR